VTVPNVQYPIVVQATPTIWRGDDFEWEIPLNNADGSPCDMSGFGPAWAASMRVNMDDDEHVDFVVDPAHLADGYITLSLDSTQTAALTFGKYGFDVQASGGAVSPFTVFTGVLPVDGDYTR
jgi:hypothetical protein